MVSIWKISISFLAHQPLYSKPGRQRLVPQSKEISQLSQRQIFSLTSKSSTITPLLNIQKFRY